MTPSLLFTIGWLPVLTGASTGFAPTEPTPTPSQATPVEQTVQGWVDTVEQADAVTRRSLCRAAHQGTRQHEVDPGSHARLQAACPAEFPVAAPPDFCLTGRCATL